MLRMYQPLSLCSLWRSSLPRHSQKPIAVSSNWQGDQCRLHPYEQYNTKIVTGNFLSLNSIPIIRATPFPPHPATPTPTPTPHTIQTRAFIMNKTRGSRIVQERGNSSGPSIIRKVYHSVISGLREGWGADQRSTSRSSWISRSCNCSLNGGLSLLKHAMKEKVFMITIDLKVIAFVCQWANSINPFLGSFLFFNSLLSTFSPYFIHKATEQQSLMGGGDPLCKEG